MVDEDLTTERGLPGRIVRSLRADGPLMVLDLAVVFVSYLAALVLRFDGEVPPGYWARFWPVVGAATLVYLGSNRLFGLYGEMWRFASVHEARRVILSGVTAGGFVVGAVTLLGADRRALPISVVALGAMMTIAGSGTIRFQSRLFAFRRRTVGERTRVLLVGAGEGGADLLSDMLRDPSFHLQPVGIVDDDPRKVGRSVHEVPVLGTRREIPDLVRRLRVDQVLLAIPSATSETIRDIGALCEEAGAALRVVPSVKEVVGGKILVRDIRDVQIEDLLGRRQVDIDEGAVRELLAGRRVLVTGAGGSIGAEIARQVAGTEHSSLVLLDHDETHLHDVAVELGTDPRVTYSLADIRDRDRMIVELARHRPDLVFHAAAHKHLPILERHPEEAVMTNIIGSANVVDAAVAAGVRRFVLISTDKAVGPTSVMGASKRFAEHIVRSLHGNGCTFCAVRFGNVLGSRGSVIPTFLRQIARGGPVTVTDPAMARYFMSTREAVQLVLQAAALAEGGEVFTLNMGEPVNILELARNLIRSSGRTPGKDVEIVITGASSGEKLREDVVDPSEEPLPSGHPDIVISRPAVPDPALLRHAISELETLAILGGADVLADRIKELASRPLEAVPT